MKNFAIWVVLFLLFAVHTVFSDIRVAVTDFQNESSEFYLDQWETLVPDMIQQELSGTDELVVLERRQLKSVLEEHALALSGLLDSVSAQKAGDLLQAEYVITGTIRFSEGRYRIDSKIIKVSSGQTHSEQVDGPGRDALPRMVRILGNNIGYNLTGHGRYVEKERLTRYPVKYFLVAAAGLGLTTALLGNSYQNRLDEYRQNTDLDKFNSLYDKANLTKKTTILAASLTGVAVMGTIYCWIRNMSPEMIYTEAMVKKRLYPYLAYHKQQGISIGAQISF